MPIRKVQAPNGRMMEVNAPEGSSDEQVKQLAAQEYYSDVANIPPKYTVGETISKGFSRGMERVGSTFGDVIPAMIGSGLGFKDYATRQMEEAKASQDYIQRSLRPEFSSFKDVQGFGDAGKFILETITEQVPNFATMFVSGGIGSQAARVGAKEFAKKYAGKELAEQMAKRQLKGQSAGVFLGSYALNAPEVFQNIYDETGELATGTALLFGAGAASLDSVLPKSILSKVSPYEKLAITKEVLKKSGTNPTLANRVFKGLTKGAISEGLTEGAQEAISISAEKFVGNNPQIFDSEDFDRILEASVRGLVAGGGLGAAAAPFERTETQAPPVTTAPPTEEKPVTKAVSDQAEVIPQPEVKAKPEPEPEPTPQAPVQQQLPGMEEVPGPVKPKEQEIKESKLMELLNKNKKNDIKFDERTGFAFIPAYNADGNIIGIRQQWKWDGKEWKTQKYFPDTPSKRKQQPLPFSTPIPVQPGSKDIVSTEIENAQAKIPEVLANNAGYEYNETNNTAYDPKSKKSYAWDSEQSQWQESENVNETKSGTDTTLGISPSVSEQPSTTAPREVESLDDGRVGETRDDVRDADRGATKRDDSLDEQATIETSSIDIVPTLKAKTPKFRSAQEVYNELYNEFGEKLIKRFVDRGRFEVVDTFADLPVSLQRATGGNAAAFFAYMGNLDRQTTGKTYIIADKFNQGTARNVLLHEVGEHYGLEVMLGKDYMPTLLQLTELRKTDPLVKEAFESVEQRYGPQGVKLGTETGKTFLREVAAYIGETAPENTWFQRLMGKVKNFLRRIGLYDPTKITSRDLQEMILYSLNRSLRESAPSSQFEPDMATSIEGMIFGKGGAPYGGSNETTMRRMFNAADKAIKATPEASKGILDSSLNVLSNLPDYGRRAVTGLLGLPAMAQLYGKYLPSIDKLIKEIEKRGGAVDRARTDATRLAQIGQDIMDGKERKRISFVQSKSGKEISLEDIYNGSFDIKDGTIEIRAIDNTKETEKYSAGTLRKWAQVVNDLSRGDDGAYQNGINPANPENDGLPLVREFKKLPKELQLLAMGYTNYYNRQADKFNQTVIDVLPGDNRMEKLQRYKKELIDNRLEFYQPFLRRGNYGLTYQIQTATELVPYTERFRSARERDQAIERLKQQGVSMIRPFYDREASRKQADSATSQFFQKVIDEVNERFNPAEEGLSKREIAKRQAAADKLIDELYSIYLDLFPSGAIKQQTRRRKGTRGEIQNPVAVFQDVSGRMSTQLINLEYIPKFDRLRNEMDQERKKAIVETIPADDTLSPEDKAKISTSVDEVYKDVAVNGRAYINNPVADPISANMAYVSFWSTIAGNVSSAVVNLTQMAIVVYPMLIGKYGFNNANKYMTEAIKDFVSGGQDNNRQFMPDVTFGMKNGHRRSQENADKGLIKQEDVLSQEMLDLYDYGVENSVFKRGLTYELTEYREIRDTDFKGFGKVKTRADQFLGWLFQNTERLNRELTFLAAYKAERNANPDKPFEQAAQVAQDMTRESHGTALTDVGPRYFQTGFGKVMFTFKRFAHAMTSIVLRLGYEGLKGGNARRSELATLIATTSDPKLVAQYKQEMQELKMIKSVARKQLAGIYGMSFAFAGMQGMPFYGSVEAITEALYAMFGDEDEPFDFNEEVRSIFGDIGYKGPLNKLTNLDVAARTGFANLYWRDDPRRIQEIGVLGYTMESLLGPTYSYARSFGRGVEDMSQGEVYRGIEAMMPAFLRNPLKSFRYMGEGARTRTGAVLDDTNGYDAFMQFFGFTNEDLSKAYEQNTAMKNAERSMLRRRSGLLTAAFVARDSGDGELYQEVLRKVRDYNKTSTGRLNPITGKTLRVSYKQRKRAIEESVNGVTLTKKYRDYLQKEFGA
jgi:hypothetical protein